MDIFSASGLGDMERVIQYVNASPSSVSSELPYGITPLHFAVKGIRYEVTKYLLERTQPTSFTLDDLFRLSMLWAGIMDEKERETELIGSLLLREGADVNGRYESGRTALHWAVESRNNLIVKFLLAHGADPDALDNDGHSPVDLATGPKYEKIRALLAAAKGLSPEVSADSGGMEK